MEDEDIRAALRRGDTATAFRLLTRAHGAAVYSACCRVLKNRIAAEDAMQETLIAAFKRRSLLLDVDQIRGWLIRTAVRKCLDALRVTKRGERLQRDAPGDDAVDADVIAVLATTEDRGALEACLAELDPVVAAAVLMRYREDMPWEQVAHALEPSPDTPKPSPASAELSLDTIRMRVRRALKRLRECMISKGITP